DTRVERRRVELVLDTRPAAAGAFLPAVAVVDGLREVDTRLVRVRTWEAVLLRQCALDVADRAVACAPAVAADPHGEDDVVALVELAALVPDGRGGTVDCRVARCALQAVDDEETGAGPTVLAGAELVFGAAERPGRLHLAPSAPVVAGDRVLVDLESFRPGQPVTLGWCASPGPVVRDACGGAAPTTTVEVGADGRATARLRVPGEGDGPGSRGCGPRRPCAVAVVGAGRSASVAVQPVTFAGPPGPDVPGTRRALGLLLAGAMLAAAVALVATTARRAPGDDPFEGVGLDVPEWEGISLDDEPEEVPVPTS
ncbi:MAG: hypothetical protein AB7O29_05175, partial [Acidimicrobiia bacterium]